MKRKIRQERSKLLGKLTTQNCTRTLGSILADNGQLFLPPTVGQSLTDTFAGNVANDQKRKTSEDEQDNLKEGHKESEEQHQYIVYRQNNTI